MYSRVTKLLWIKFSAKWHKMDAITYFSDSVLRVSQNTICSVTACSGYYRIQSMSIRPVMLRVNRSCRWGWRRSVRSWGVLRGPWRKPSRMLPPFQVKYYSRFSHVSSNSSGLTGHETKVLHWSPCRLVLKLTSSSTLMYLDDLISWPTETNQSTYSHVIFHWRS